jgi:hypothetical protein
MKKAMILLGLLLIAGICLAQFATHPDWVTFTRTSDTTGTIRWATTPTDFVVYYYLAVHPDDGVIYFPGPGGEPPWNSGTTPGWDAPLASYEEGPGVYKWDFSDPTMDPAKGYIAYVAAVNGGWAWLPSSVASSLHNPPPILPVELSNFSAMMTASRFVNISWTSQSETNMLGYRVFRSESPNLADAEMITPTMIDATNTSTTCTYNKEDHEVQAGNTYWYWLQSIDFVGEEFHGPASVRVTDEPNTPGVTEQTGIISLYPNPLRPGGTLTMDVNVKSGEQAVATVYNSRGQAITTYTVNEGNHKLAWNGLDSNGNKCSSGMYYFRISSDSISQTRKLVIVK